MPRDNYLFADRDLSDVIHGANRRIGAAVEEISVDQFNVSNDEQLIAYIQQSFELDPLVLHEDRATMEQSPTQVDVSGDPGRDWGFDRQSGPLMVSGTRVQITIPFTGDRSLWRMKPSRWRSTFPYGNIRSSSSGEILELSFSKPHDVPEEAFKKDYDSLMNDVRFYVDSQRGEIEKYNSGLRTIIESAIRDRRDRLAKHQDISKVLDIPLKPKDGAPPVDPIQVKEKITVPLPLPQKNTSQPEPGISDEVFETILKIIRNQGRSFESAPKTFVKLDEEELRDVMLSQLNNYFEGGATGETFRRAGKTDIHILDNSRAAFVGECKIWRGPKEVGPSVDQLLTYLTWRDCKAALIFFNTSVKGFTELLEKMPEALGSHENTISKPMPHEAGEWRISFKSKEDEMRRVIVHVFMFNLFG